LKVLFDSSSQLSLNIDMNNIQTKEDIQKYTDDSCKDTCIVFVDGIYSQEHSSISKLPEGIHKTSTDINDSLFQSIKHQLLYIPDSEELPRNSFQSNLITAHNLVKILL
jgi:hypothetical protein